MAAASALLDRGWGKLPALSPDNVRLSDLEERFVCAWVDDEAKLRAIFAVSGLESIRAQPQAMLTT